MLLSLIFIYSKVVLCALLAKCVHLPKIFLSVTVEWRKWIFKNRRAISPTELVLVPSANYSISSNYTIWRLTQLNFSDRLQNDFNLSNVFSCLLRYATRKLQKVAQKFIISCNFIISQGIPQTKQIHSNEP